MRSRSPGTAGKFTVNNYDLKRDGYLIAEASISYFSPYFYNDDDFRFLDALNVILAGGSIFSLLLAISVGWVLARHMSSPIRKTAEIAKQMSGGNYVVRMEETTNIRELGELMHSVNQLAHSLSRQESLRKQLTADVAHELRTPLTNIATHIEAMMEGIWDPTPERLSSCHEEIERINKLIQDLENLAKVESDNLKLDKTQISLLELLKKTLSSFEADIAVKKLNVSVDGICPDVLADQRRMQQVLINLLSNAVKYTRPGGTIHMAFSETNDSVLLAVEDNGIGIPQEELPFIFERFYRADKSRNRLSGGSGIGLAVVKAIVTAHGGKIEVKSHFENGSSFLVTLPKLSY
jgi:signal transduction histidine kinase